MSIAGGGLVCGPQNITGPVEHTLFLGCSVIDFTCTMGWNEQASSIDVNLVEDPCDAPASHPKHYYPLPGTNRQTTGPDPGFIYPTIGAPVYFKVGSFEFAGVVQSWSRKSDTGGNPTFQISITDPRFLLENLQIIVSDYGDSVEGVYNLINVYGNLESLGYACPESFIGGAAFGSPADAFGGAENNDEGTPWTKIRDATQALLTGNIHPEYSPYGFAVYRGNNPNNFSNLGGMGALSHDSFNAQVQSSFNSGGYLAHYYVDISEIPFAPTYYRIPGPSVTLMALISQICDDAGCDFFVELFVTSAGDKIIKVRTAVRKLQPTLGQIEQFVDAQASVTAKNIGRELRNEPTSVFGYGGYIESLYTQPDPARIHQYWGADSQGATMNAVFVRNQHNMEPSIPEWWVDIDVTALTPNLFSPPSATTVQVSETEMRMALGGYDSWREYALFTGTAFGTWMRTLGPNGQSSIIKTQRKPSDRTRDGDASNNITVNTNLGLQNPGRYDAKDMTKVHKFISEYADTYYGKQFIIELPLICYAFDNDSNRFQYSDNPNPQGGFPASTTTSILNLAYPNGAGMDFFLTEKDKVQPILRYIPASGSGTSVEGSSFIYQSNSLYLKGVTQESFIFRNGAPHALLTVSNPVRFSGLEDGSPSAFGAYTKIAFGNGDGKSLSVNSDINGGKGRSAWAMETKRLTPDEVAVPMVSNTNRYGPWFKQGPPGPVTLVTDDNLVPWEYGGYTVMNLAAAERIDDATTFMQVGERGSFTMPGYPIKGLGQEVRAAQPVMANFSVQQSSFTINGTPVSYWYVSTSPLDGTFGPNITQISTSVGSNGLTTTYSLATFTPSFGRMSKLNAGRIKKVAAQRQAMLKDQRRQRKLSVIATQVAQRVAQQSVEKRAIAAEAPASNIIMGANVDTVETDGTKVGSKTSVVGIGSTINQASSDAYNTGWTKQAMMGPEGIYRPVSKFGGMNTSSSRSSGFLPQYTRRRYNSTYEGSLACAVGSGTNASGPKHSTPPLLAGVSGGAGNNGYNPLSVFQKYLDPFATPNTDKHLLAGVPKTGTHHDVDTIAFGGNNPNGQIMSLMENENQGNAFPDDFRMMAMRGPVLINGWGYDLEGKPIPNSADTDSAMAVGEFVDTNLTNSFPADWLRKPDTWPVAPLDLRFDRARGVWTSPPPERMLYGKVTVAAGVSAGVNIAGTEQGTARIWNSDFPDDPTGAPLYASTQPLISFTNVLNVSGLNSGTKAWFHWDPNSCVYFPIVDGLGSGGGGGSATLFYDAGYCGHSGHADVLASGAGSGAAAGITSLTFGSGLKLVQHSITGSGANSGSYNYLQADHYISDLGDCDHLGSVDNEFFTKLVFGSGLRIDSSGSCVYSIHSAQKLTDLSYCGYGTASGASSGLVSGAYYSNLNIGSGLKIVANAQYTSPTGSGEVPQLIAGSDCSLTIQADHTISDTSFNSYAESITSGSFFNHLVFGSGLKVSGIQASGESGLICQYEIYADHSITDLDYCGHSGDTSSGLNSGTFFSNLSFGTGLKVSDLTNGSYQIDADHTVSDLSYADYGGTIQSGFFNNLSFGSGLRVSGIQAGGESGVCKYQITADHSISDGYYCDYSGDGSAGASGLVSGLFFNKLIFGTGLKVHNTGLDSFRIDVDNKILDASYGVPYAGHDLACYYSGINAETSGEGDHLRKLVVGTGLRMTSSGDCSYAIHTNMMLRESSVDGCNPTGTQIWKPFTALNFGSGLNVSGGPDFDSCGYTITAWIPHVEATGQTPAQPSIPFRSLQISSGLRLLTDPDESGCRPLVVNDHKVYDWGCQGEPGGTYGGETICDKGGATPGGLVSPLGGHVGTVYGYGLDVAMATGEELKGTAVVNTRLKVAAVDATGGYVTKIETIDLGCGLSGTHVGGKTCEPDGGREICGVKIELNPRSAGGTTTGIDVVNGICCTGAHITASFITLRFSSCGLFIEATGGTGCCS